jgi:hypothetical protein
MKKTEDYTIYNEVLASDLFTLPIWLIAYISAAIGYFNIESLNIIVPLFLGFIMGIIAAFNFNKGSYKEINKVIIYQWVILLILLPVVRNNFIIFFITGMTVGYVYITLLTIKFRLSSVSFSDGSSNPSSQLEVNFSFSLANVILLVVVILLLGYFGDTIKLNERLLSSLISLWYLFSYMKMNSVFKTLLIEGKL